MYDADAIRQEKPDNNCLDHFIILILQPYIVFAEVVHNLLVKCYGTNLDNN